MDRVARHCAQRALTEFYRFFLGKVKHESLRRCLKMHFLNPEHSHLTQRCCAKRSWCKWKLPMRRRDICGTKLHAARNLEANCLHYLTPLSLVTLPALSSALESASLACATLKCDI